MSWLLFIVAVFSPYSRCWCSRPLSSVGVLTLFSVLATSSTFEWGCSHLTLGVGVLVHFFHAQLVHGVDLGRDIVDLWKERCWSKFCYPSVCCRFVSDDLWNAVVWFQPPSLLIVKVWVPAIYFCVSPIHCLNAMVSG